MSQWKHVNEQLLPIDQIVIAISSSTGEQADWVCIGKVDPAYRNMNEYDYRTNVITTVGNGVHSIKWWHPIPKLPVEKNGEWDVDSGWIACFDVIPPQKRNDSFSFILFDGKEGIAEAEYWGGYQSDTWSCKHYFKKPLFWRPFPVLPIKSFDILQC